MNILKTRFNACVLKPATVAIVSVVISSCGGASNNSGADTEVLPSESVDQQSETNLPGATQGGTQTAALADGSWALDDIVFIGHDPLAVQNNNDDSVFIGVDDWLSGRSNGDYSGSALRIRLSSNGTGDYVVTDEDSANSAFASGVNVASLNVIAGVVSGNATSWDSTETSGNLTVTVNGEGRYFVSTIEPIIVTKIGESGTGVVGAPDQISLKFRNINGNTN